MHRIHTLTIALSLTLLAPLGSMAANNEKSYDELAGASDRIVLGTIGAKTSFWGEASRIYTDVVIYPDVTIKGAEQGALTVRALGGTVGDTTMAVSDGPEFPQGERAVLFLKADAGRFVVTERSRGSVPVSSPDAPRALERAFANVERGGLRQSSKRDFAASYMSGSRGGLNSRATSTAAAQVGCYSTDGAKWATTSATYKLTDSIPSGWAGSINASAATWSSAGIAFSLLNDVASANELSLSDLVAKYGSSYANTYAVTTTWSSTSTGRISKAAIEINNRWQWSTAGEANMADVQNIITHEFGHWMRLLDIYSPSDCSAVTMFGTAALGETNKRTLEQPDLDGFASLYGMSVPAVAAPVLLSPANGAANTASSVTLTWGAAANATSYDVYLGTSTSPALLGGSTAISAAANGLTPGATYYWRVVAKNAAGSASSGTFSFTVAGAPAGTQGPNLISPANGAVGVSLSPVMQWTAVPGATSYDIYVGTASQPGRIGTVSGTVVTVTGFRSGTVYYWKVVARTSTQSLSSLVASFRTN